MAWRVYLTSALVSCLVGAASAWITVRLLVPSTPASGTASGVVILEGVAEVPLAEEVVVHYPAPFAAAPNLTFPDGLDSVQCKVTEQQPGSFKVQRSNSAPPGVGRVAKLKWRAEGKPGG